MPYEITDEQREILGREMVPENIDGWVAGVMEHGDAAALEAKIAIIAAAKAPHGYEEMRRR